MKKMLIVDDNKRERVGVAGIIDWKKYGIDVVQTCANGKQALEYTEQNKVDIILSDVEMPIMSGISLLKILRERGNEAKFIFMSCYDEFDFVKSAMDLGATGYILKPINTDELVSLVEKVLKLHRSDEQAARRRQLYDEMIENNREILIESFFRQLLFDAKYDTGLMKREAELLKIPNSYDVARVMLIKLYPDSEESADIMVFVSEIVEKMSAQLENGIYSKPVIVGRDKVVVVFLYNRSQSSTVIEMCMELKEYSWNVLSVETAFGISNESEKSMSELHALYAQAEEAIDTSFVSGDERIILYEEVEERKNLSFGFIDISELQKDVNSVISSGNAKLAKDMICKYLSDVDMVSNRNYIRYFSYMLLNVIETSLINTNINTDSIIEYSKVWSKLANIDTIFDIYQWFENIFKSVFETIELSRKAGGGDLVRAVKDIIESEYATHITMKYIAERLHFSGVHINNVFKRETGMAIFDYLVDYRIEIAKKLLQQKGSKVYAVAKSVGYTNQTHFKVLFVQHVGMTPLEYKNIYEEK